MRTRRLTAAERAQVRRIELAANALHASTYKLHLPAADQTARTVGVYVHDPERSVVTYCGRVFSRSAIDCWLVVTKPEQATCKICTKAHDRRWDEAFGTDV